ncbi:MAG TPA: hypothetical protein VIP11_01510 [Gemmatimonadaceae bacterium]
MSQNTTAGRLLESLRDESPAVRDAVTLAAALPAERADAAMVGALRLTLSEQLRLAEATIVTAPKFRRDALRLRGQVLAARSFEAQELVERHRDPPVQRWEVSSQIRR